MITDTQKIFKIKPVMLCLMLIVFLNTEFLYCQKKPERPNPIPDDINLILQPFCYSCHGPAGGRLPRSRLNFVAWNSYSPGKQADKAVSICSTMRKRTMPTKLWNQQNPGMKLTSEQINIICNWAESVRLGEQRKNNREIGKKQGSSKENRALKK
jgi:hypothetical protein